MCGTDARSRQWIMGRQPEASPSCIYAHRHPGRWHRRVHHALGVWIVLLADETAWQTLDDGALPRFRLLYRHNHFRLVTPRVGGACRAKLSASGDRSGKLCPLRAPRMLGGGRAQCDAGDLPLEAQACMLRHPLDWSTMQALAPSGRLIYGALQYPMVWNSAIVDFRSAAHLPERTLAAHAQRLVRCKLLHSSEHHVP